MEYYKFKLYFAEIWEENWIYSEHPGKEFGKFKWSSGKFYNDAEKDKGRSIFISMFYKI